ncbi:hypothetical protein GNT69_24555 [Bacillus sp. B15-48]|nr:hypothetical protein [Bacillus sp. B15-48]
MRGRAKKPRTSLFERLREFFVTVILHLSFYAFMIFIVLFFIESFS